MLHPLLSEHSVGDAPLQREHLPFWHQRAQKQCFPLSLEPDLVDPLAPLGTADVENGAQPLPLGGEDAPLGGAVVDGYLPVHGIASLFGWKEDMRQHRKKEPPLPTAAVLFQSALQRLLPFMEGAVATRRLREASEALCIASYRCIVYKKANSRGTQRKNSLLLLLSEPPPAC